MVQNRKNFTLSWTEIRIKSLPGTRVVFKGIHQVLVSYFLVFFQRNIFFYNFISIQNLYPNQGDPDRRWPSTDFVLKVGMSCPKEKLVFQKYENKHLGNVTVCIVSVNLSPLSLGQINLDPILEYFNFRRLNTRASKRL